MPLENLLWESYSSILSEIGHLWPWRHVFSHSSPEMESLLFRCRSPLSVSVPHPLFLSWFLSLFFSLPVSHVCCRLSLCSGKLLSFSIRTLFALVWCRYLPSAVAYYTGCWLYGQHILILRRKKRMQTNNIMLCMKFNLQRQMHNPLSIQNLLAQFACIVIAFVLLMHHLHFIFYHHRLRLLVRLCYWPLEMSN